MLKEIYEQPSALWDTIGDRLRPDGSVDLVGLGLDDAALARVERIHIVACGTSYHAGLVGRYLIEDWARVPVHVEVASEYRYRTCLAGPGDLVMGITQSGETADTLAAMRVARERGRPRRGRSPTSWARRPPATPTACSTRAPAWRSASPRPRPTPPR